MVKLLKVTATQNRMWEDAFDEFLMFKKAEGIAPHTLQDYQKRVTRFFNLFPNAWIDYRRLRSAVTKHFATLADHASATYNLPLAYLRCFFSWCVNEGIMPTTPTDGLKRKKDAGKARDVDADALRKLLDLPARNTYTGIRDYALILLQLDTGIRPGEALHYCLSILTSAPWKPTSHRGRQKPGVPGWYVLVSPLLKPSVGSWSAVLRPGKI